MKINSRLVALAYASALAVMAGCTTNGPGGPFRLIEPQVIDENTPYIPLDRGHYGEYEWTRGELVYIGAEYHWPHSSSITWRGTHEQAKQHCMQNGYVGVELISDKPRRYLSLRPAKKILGQTPARDFWWDVKKFRCTLGGPIKLQ